MSLTWNIVKLSLVFCSVWIFLPFSLPPLVYFAAFGLLLQLCGNSRTACKHPNALKHIACIPLPALMRQIKLCYGGNRQQVLLRYSFTRFTKYKEMFVISFLLLHCFCLISVIDWDKQDKCCINTTEMLCSIIENTRNTTIFCALQGTESKVEMKPRVDQNFLKLNHHTNILAMGVVTAANMQWLRRKCGLD